MDASPQPVWLVYLLECADGSLYCGITNNLKRRLAQHNGLVPGGARYTRARRPVRLAAVHSCRDKADALRLEHRVKSSPRHRKVQVLHLAEEHSRDASEKPDSVSISHVSGAA